MAQSLFDYGCGRGSDVAALAANGIEAAGWDPHYAPDHPIAQADVVNLGFVLNVIEDPAERADVLHRAFKLANRVLAVGVMLYAGEPPGRPYRDGYLTSRRTFQKYFTQEEFKDYLEQVLHHEAFMVGPGVAFVFADKDWEQRFGASRFRARDVAARLLSRQIRPVRERSPVVPKEKSRRLEAVPDAPLALSEAQRACLQTLWRTALDLGRLPEDEEIFDAADVVAQFGSTARALRHLAKEFDPALLAVAAQARKDDLGVYLAMQYFAKRPAFHTLEARLRRDIRAFFGHYTAAQAAGRALLHEAADASQLLRACQTAATAGLGWLDQDHSLQLHLSLVDRLPAALRVYVACGLLLWDAVSHVDLVKIHITSGKLTLLEFDQFDQSPTPLLRRRIKVNVRIQDYELYEYGSPQYPQPVLYHKSRYLHEDYPGYAEQLVFDEALLATGLVSEATHGPSLQELHERLAQRRLQITGARLQRSQTIPALDQACGAHLRYRDLIECGETQATLGLSNVPLQPESYNALCDLATEILDPVIDYFGSIRLTYGFCSADLGRHIHRRVAPALDQHAAAEKNRVGKLICDRGGAACDFLVDDEDMLEVARWIAQNLAFDRLYVYGAHRPIHVSYGPQRTRAVFQMVPTKTGTLVPRVLKL